MENRQELIKGKLKMLRDVYLMSERDIGAYLGVGACVVSWWKNGKHTITKNNYDKVSDMLLKLSGCNVRYKGQALDILREQEG